MSTQIQEITARFEESFEGVRKATKPLATAAVSETTVKGLRKAIGSYIEICNSIIKDLRSSTPSDSAGSLSDASQLKAENTLLSNKVQSLAFSVQEAETNLARNKAQSEEEISNLKIACEGFSKRSGDLQAELEKYQAIEQQLTLEKSENTRLQQALSSISEQFSLQRMEWQNKVADSVAVNWEDRHMLHSQRTSEESLRTHIGELLEENRLLRSSSLSVDDIQTKRSTSAIFSNTALDVLKASLATIQKDYDKLTAENNSLLRKNEKLLSEVSMNSIAKITRVQDPEPKQKLHFDEKRCDQVEKRVRHVSVQVFDNTESLEAISLRLQDELRACTEEKKYFKNLAENLQHSQLQNNEEVLRQEILSLRCELKKKSLRVSRLIADIDLLRCGASDTSPAALVESQKARAAAELEILSLRNHVKFVEAKSSTTISNHLPNATFSDPLLPIHVESLSLNWIAQTTSVASKDEVRKLQDEVAYQEAAVQYWEQQSNDSINERMLQDAIGRLNHSRMRAASLIGNNQDAQKQLHLKQSRLLERERSHFRHQQ